MAAKHAIFGAFHLRDRILMRRLALAVLLLSPLLFWAAGSGFRAESGKELSLATETLSMGEPHPPGEARAGSGNPPVAENVPDLPRARPVQWHRFLPGMFR
jgi:hypothetical protein